MATCPRVSRIACAFALIASLAPVGDAFACTVVTVMAPEDLVRVATYIIRVRALRQCAELACLPPAAAGIPAQPLYARRLSEAVEFEVLETLKGGALPARLWFEGRLVSSDQYNDGTVPYAFGRSSFTCNPRTFRAGSEYLLMLRPVGAYLTPNWAPGIASNEQLRGDDRWLGWVRQAILRHSEPRITPVS